MRLILISMGLLLLIVSCTKRPGTSPLSYTPPSPTPPITSPPGAPALPPNSSIRGIWKQDGCSDGSAASTLCFYDEDDTSVRTLNITDPTAVRITYDDEPGNVINGFVSSSSLCMLTNEGDQLCYSLFLYQNSLLFCLDDFCEKYNRSS